jgi:hypothetical protein
VRAGFVSTSFAVTDVSTVPSSVPAINAQSYTCYARAPAARRTHTHTHTKEK